MLVSIGWLGGQIDMPGEWINEFYSISDPVSNQENTNLLLPFLQRNPLFLLVS